MFEEIDPTVLTGNTESFLREGKRGEEDIAVSVLENGGSYRSVYRIELAGPVSALDIPAEESPELCKSP